MNWEVFIGRFHPLMVHLPIGIFILGYLFELMLRFGFSNLIHSRKIVVVTYCIGLFSGIVAAVTGWLLSFSNNYGFESLNDHKLLGIVTLGAMLLVVIYQIKAPDSKANLKLMSSTLAIVLTVFTGHLGGNITHGRTFLTEYGPTIFKVNENSFQETVSKKQPDSVQIYSDIIKPLIHNNCFACHNSNDNYGGLILENYNDFFKESDHSMPVMSGNPDKSELFKRVSLPNNNEKVMPPKGQRFSYTDIQILKYWIENGADSLASFNSSNMDKELVSLINRDYGLDYSSRPYYEKVQVDSLDEKLLTQLRRSGFKSNYLGKNNLLMDVEFRGDSIGIEHIDILNLISSQITFLKISNCNLSDELVEKIGNIEHLTKIDFSKNKITDSVVSFLIEQENLEVANLNETSITKTPLQQLLSESAVQRIYVWNTKLTTEDVLSLKKSYPDVEIISQFKFTEVPEFKSVFAQKENALD